jgi:hypothetical protein
MAAGAELLCTANFSSESRQMTHITVSADIARQITVASMPIVLVDENGRRLGELTQIDSETLPPGLTREEWEEIIRRMEKPGEYTTLKEIKQSLGWQDPT